MKETVLLTGATGFIGQRIALALQSAGYQVCAVVRATSQTSALQAQGIELLMLDMGNKESMRQAFTQHNGWDYVIHGAGLTKALRKVDFMRVNYENTRAFVEALTEADRMPRKFVFLSSLSVYGSLHETDGKPFNTEDTPQPNTAYGQSKRKAEAYLQSIRSEFPSVILRPTGVYGPGDRDYLMMFRTVKQGFDVRAGRKPQTLTFVHADDVAQATQCALEQSTTSGAVYDISDGSEYDASYFAQLIKQELGIRRAWQICVPLCLLWLVSGVSESLSHISGKAATLNRDKFRIMKQRSWRCDTQPAIKDLGYMPRYSLQEGVKETIKWYKEAGWL